MQITVTHQDHWDSVLVLYSVDLFFEGSYFIEGASTGNGVHENETLSCTHVSVWKKDV